VLTCDGRISAWGTLALLRLATRDARPHLVVRGATSALGHPTRLVRMSGVVHDAGATRRTPRLSADELVETAWRRCTGAETAPAEATACARWAVMLAPSIESEAVARSALASGLVGQGLSFEARAVLAPLGEIPDRLPDTVRQRIDLVEQQLGAAERPRRSDRALVDDFLDVLQVCQDVDDEEAALGRVLVKLRDRIACTRMAYVVREDQELRVVSTLGGHPGHSSIPG